MNKKIFLIVVTTIILLSQLIYSATCEGGYCYSCLPSDRNAPYPGDDNIYGYDRNTYGTTRIHWSRTEEDQGDIYAPGESCSGNLLTEYYCVQSYQRTYGTDYINCSEYNEYCSQGACHPCDCEPEEGECCIEPCIYQEQTTGCELTGNIAGGNCTGTNSACPIFDENNDVDGTGACDLIAAYNWNGDLDKSLDIPQTLNNQRGTCCGDDGNQESGIVAENRAFQEFLCAEKPNEHWEWLYAFANSGTIFEIQIDENRFDAVAASLLTEDNIKWYSCNHEFRTHQTQKLEFGEKVFSGLNEYICFNDKGYSRIAECKGDGGSNNRNDDIFGTSNATGEYITIETQRHYCTDTHQWTTDLDSFPNTCDALGEAGWTGSMCCGDTDEIESYNDTEHGCFNNIKIENNTKITDLPKILNYNGQFYSCFLGPSQVHTNTITGENLIQENFENCAGKGDYFCDPTLSQWNDELAGTDRAGKRTTEKSIPEQLEGTGLIESSCCPSDWCWNGEECIANMAASTEETGDEIILPSNNMLRCINGQWAIAYHSKTWDNITNGFCPEETDCLVDINGNFDSNYIPGNYGKENLNPQCIANTQSILDHYCNNRKWTSRTKFIANQLLEIADDDYVLFCDEYPTSLNDFQFNFQTTTIEDYLGGPIIRQLPLLRACSTDYETNIPCTNNFCILNSDDQIYFGTSLNQPINTEQNSILEALEFLTNHCDNVNNDSDIFTKCTTSSGEGEIWFNPKINSIIYSKTSFSLTTPTEDIITEKLEPVVENAREIVLFSNTVFDWISVKDYNKIYLNEKAIKKIYAVSEFGVKDEQSNEYLAVQYTDLGNICSMTARISGLECRDDGNTYYIASQSPRLDYFWPELTSKIRLS